MTVNLPAVLETSDMLEIDGLHAFDFELDAEKLLITAMEMLTGGAMLLAVGFLACGLLAACSVSSILIRRSMHMIP